MNNQLIKYTKEIIIIMKRFFIKMEKTIFFTEKTEK